MSVVSLYFTDYIPGLRQTPPGLFLADLEVKASFRYPYSWDIIFRSIIVLMTTVDFTVSRKEYFKVSLSAFFFTGYWKVIFWLIAATSFLVTLFDNPLSGQSLLYSFPLLLMSSIIMAFISMFLALIFLIGLTFFRLRAESPLIDSPIKFGFSPDMFTLQNELARTESKWEFVRKVLTVNKCYLLQTKNPGQQAVFVPKSAFSNDQIKEFEDLLNEKHLLFLKPRIPIGKRILTILLIMVIAVLIYGLASVAIPYFKLRAELKSDSLVTSTPASDFTANWKTYRDSKWEYQFMYPPTWQINKVSADQVIGGGPEKRGSVSPYLNIIVWTRDTTLTLQQEATERAQGPGTDCTGNPNAGVCPPKPIKSIENKSNINLKQYYYVIAANSLRSVFIPISNNPSKFIEFDCSCADTASIQLFDRLISTFQFILGAAEIPNPDMYENNKYGFSFNYSKDYFKFQQISDRGVYLAPSAGVGGNGPKFLSPGDVWLNVGVEPDVNWKSLNEYLDSESVRDRYSNAYAVVYSTLNGYEINYDFAAVAGNVRVYNDEVLVLRNKKLYKITLSAWDKTILLQKKQLFAQVINSFKFKDVSTQAKGTNSELLPILGWVKADNGIFSVKYPADTFNAITLGKGEIQLRLKTSQGNGTYSSPDLTLADDYKGGSAKSWYLNHFGYGEGGGGEQVFFEDKVLGNNSVVEVAMASPLNMNEILVSNGVNLVDVLGQGTNVLILETIASTMTFK